MIMYSILFRIKKINYKDCYGIYDDVIICYKNVCYELIMQDLPDGKSGDLLIRPFWYINN